MKVSQATGSVADPNPEDPEHFDTGYGSGSGKNRIRILKEQNIDQSHQKFIHKILSENFFL